MKINNLKLYLNIDECYSMLQNKQVPEYTQYDFIYIMFIKKRKW